MLCDSSMKIYWSALPPAEQILRRDPQRNNRCNEGAKRNFRHRTTEAPQREHMCHRAHKLTEVTEATEATEVTEVTRATYSINCFVELASLKASASYTKLAAAFAPLLQCRGGHKSFLCLPACACLRVSKFTDIVGNITQVCVCVCVCKTLVSDICWFWICGGFGGLCLFLISTIVWSIGHHGAYKLRVFGLRSISILGLLAPWSL